MAPSNATGRLFDNTIHITSASQYRITLSFAVLFHILFLARAAPRFSVTAKQIGLLVLLFHIAVSAIELLRWNYTRVTTEAEQIANTIDIILCIAQVTSTMMIIRRHQKGHPDIVRPIFQAVAPYRFVLTTAAYVLQSPALHRASVMTNRGFLYVRIGILGFAMFDRLKGSKASIYTSGSYLDSTLSTLDSDIALGWATFGYCIILTSKVSRWTTQQVLPSSEIPTSMSAMRFQLVRLLLWIGMADLQTVKAYDDGSLLNGKTGEKEQTS